MIAKGSDFPLEGRTPINRVSLYCADSLAYKLDLLVWEQLKTEDQKVSAVSVCLVVPTSDETNFCDSFTEKQETLFCCH